MHALRVRVVEGVVVTSYLATTFGVYMSSVGIQLFIH